ncbi:hypothetical protein A1O3_03832 [Capronia epimyces CBS 606.96]|uniref:COX assembly mitochondrial protein n=1 Tax=Capronia epimyces CBS 606.96 TaxID=1182542 RepID=W9Y321_9EURO|nr:uncharacterized protein A1O3_03832 [Capronia epimyces CBS 606.96]EXJ86878.1 hypothetical protein A1O3_03832 [Capronia epimyces CBS 606.96]
MAPSVVPEPQPPSTSRPQQNLRNPLPLSPAQEAEVRKLYYARVRSRCADEIKEFADCARGRTVSVAWHCRAQHLAMNGCMIQFATKAEEDAAREEWFAGVLERRKQKEEELAAVEKRRVEVIELTRKQEEKERLEMEKKLAEEKQNEGKKTRGSWWR